MDRLSVSKQFTIIKLYFSGLSYREIARKSGTSTGAIANIITDLRGGNYPEVGDVAEQVEILKELSAEVRKTKLTVGEAATGITVINSLKEMGIDPGDISRCVSLYRELTPTGVETPTFVKAAIEYREVLQRTGLKVEEMGKKVKHLEGACSQLEPIAAKVRGLKKELDDLEVKKAQVSDEVVKLEKSKQLLAESVKGKEKRERDLSARIVKLEEKLQTDEERLAVARNDLKILSSIGISFTELSGITERIKGVVHRHDIDPKALYNRLLTELEQMNKGLSLETLIEQKKHELQKVESAISKAQEKSTTLCNQNQQLQQELSTLRAQIAYERESISRELGTITHTAQNVVLELKQKLTKGIQESLNEVANLRINALEAGREFGQLEAMIRFHNWLEIFLSLLKGEDKVSEGELRVMFLMLLNSLKAWLERHQIIDTTPYSLKIATDNLISEFERWKPKVNSIEGSQTLSTN